MISISNKKCARLVQEATGVKYTKALRWVHEHEHAHPDARPAQTRALNIVDALVDGELPKYE